MILKALTLENFKGIREPVRVEFAPLTLLFGPNNAGKSTVVQALIYAREVLERNNCDAGRTQLGGDIVDLGGFQHLVHGHDLSRVIRMRFELDLSNIALPKYSDWVREHELESHIWYPFENAPKKIDLAAAERARSSIREVWVQVEIGWRAAEVPEGRSAPVVQGFSVGRGHDTYATIVLNERGQTALSEFGFGVPPFGVTYYQGETSDPEWTLECLARDVVRTALWINDQPRVGMEKGATVAMPDEDPGNSSRRLPRAEFDSIVSAIVEGSGDWGDSSVDEETGAPNTKYTKRNELIEYATAINNAWNSINEARNHKHEKLDLGWLDLSIDGKQVTPKEGDESGTVGIFPLAPSSKSDAIDTSALAVHDELQPLDFADRRDRFAHLEERKEVESWMLDLFDALVHDDFVPKGPGREMPLTTRGTALPEWGRTLEPHGKVWLPDEPGKYTNEFWEFPAFAQEYIKDLLTTVITGPGELLLRALQGSIYVSPFRAMPPRHYQPARSPDPRRWADGLAAWDWLLLKDKTFADQVNEWLSGKERFDAGYAIDLRHYRELEIDSPILTALTAAADGDLDRNWVREELLKLTEGRRLQIKDLRSGISLFPQDLGVGISQVIPVIVAALHSTEGVVAIEEPESNIHPAFQVVLADLFMTQAKANPNLVFLIETHSEHLMLRCLRRIRETTKGLSQTVGAPTVTPEEVAVHFVEPCADGPRIHRIEIDGEGDFLDPWPQGFFRERVKELYGDDL